MTEIPDPSNTRAFLIGYLREEEEKLNDFVAKSGIDKYPSAYRAFKFGVKNILFRPLRPPRGEDNSSVRLPGLVDASIFLGLYRLHMPLFIALDAMDVPPDSWILMDMNEDKVFFLIKATDTVYLKKVADGIGKGQAAAKKAEWSGRVFYRATSAGGQIEIYTK